MRDFETSQVQTSVAVAVERFVTDAMWGSDRSSQAKANILGVSDIGNCHEYVRRVILNEEPSQEPHTYDLAAFIGTAIGDHMENVFVANEPGWVKQGAVTVTMTVRGVTVNITGHPDLYCESMLIDFKTKNGLGVVRKYGPTDQERFQRALYAKALIESGEMLPDPWLVNVYIDRSGEETTPVVWASRFDWAEVEEAAAWLDDVLYAIENGEEAQRDPSREWCWACCPFAPQCRGFDDSDVEGRITDPEVIEAISVYQEARDSIKLLEKDKKSAESVLRGKAGSTDTHKFRWIEVSETVIPQQIRAGYSRLDLRPLKMQRKADNDTDSGTGSPNDPEPADPGDVGGGPAQR